MKGRALWLADRRKDKEQKESADRNLPDRYCAIKTVQSEGRIIASSYPVAVTRQMDQYDLPSVSKKKGV